MAGAAPPRASEGGTGRNGFVSRILRVLRIVIVVAALCSLARPHMEPGMQRGFAVTEAYWQPSAHVREEAQGIRTLFTVLSIILVLAA